jgi:hypothetical protein
MKTEEQNMNEPQNPQLNIPDVSDSFVNNLTVGSLIEKLNFAIENGYITNEHTILIGENGDTCLVQNLTLPAVVLDSSKEFKQVQMLFTKL